MKNKSDIQAPPQTDRLSGSHHRGDIDKKPTRDLRKDQSIEEKARPSCQLLLTLGILKLSLVFNPVSFVDPMPKLQCWQDQLQRVSKHFEYCNFVARLPDGVVPANEYNCKASVASPAGPSVGIMFANLKGSFELPRMTSSHGTWRIEVAMTLSPKTMRVRHASMLCRKASRQSQYGQRPLEAYQTTKLKYSRARKIKRPKTQAK